MKSKLSRNFIRNSLTLYDEVLQITFVILEELKIFLKSTRKKSLVATIKRSTINLGIAFFLCIHKFTYMQVFLKKVPGVLIL